MTDAAKASAGAPPQLHPFKSGERNLNLVEGDRPGPVLMPRQ